MKENHEGRSSLVQWGKRRVDRLQLVQGNPEKLLLPNSPNSPLTAQELCFPSPGNYAAAILLQRCSIGVRVLRVSRADFLIGYCVLSQTHSHGFRKRCADMLAVSCCVPGTKEMMKMDSDTPGIRNEAKFIR